MYSVLRFKSYNILYSHSSNHSYSGPPTIYLYEYFLLLGPLDCLIGKYIFNEQIDAIITHRYAQSK